MEKREMSIRRLTAFAVIFAALILSACKPVSVDRDKNEGFTEWMPWVEFQEFLAEKEKKGETGKNFWDQGHWILAAEGRWEAGQQQYRIRVGDAPKSKAYLWMWYLNLEQKEFDKLIEKFTIEGYTLIYSNSFTRPSGTALFQAVWHNENPKQK